MRITIAALFALAGLLPLPAAAQERIQNEWLRGQVLHVENGPLAIGRAPPGWLSAGWIMATCGCPSWRLVTATISASGWRSRIFISSKAV